MERLKEVLWYRGDRVGKEDVAVRKLHDPPQIHESHPITQMLDLGGMMRDERYRQTKVALQVHEQTDDLCLNRYIQSRDSFVANNVVRLGCQQARDTNALSLPTRKLV